MSRTLNERSAAGQAQIGWSWGRAALGLGVSALFLWLALRRVELDEAWRTATSAATLPLLAASSVSIAGLFARGLRWSRLLSPRARGEWRALGFSAAIGFAVNNILPARVGEVVRSISASRKLKTGVAVTFGSVVVERVWDLVGALAAIAAGFLVLGSTTSLDALTEEVGRHLGIAISFTSVARNAGLVIGAFVIGVLLLKKWAARLIRMAEWMAAPLPRRWRAGMMEGLRGFGSGLVRAATRDVAVIAGVSVALWVGTGVSTWLVLGSCGIAASPTTVVLVVASLVIAVSLPGGPGYFGTYEYLAASAITISTGVDWDRAVAAALVLHLTSYVPMTFIGLMALSHEGLSPLGRVRVGAGAAEVNAVDPRPSDEEMDAATDRVDAATGRE